MGILVSWRSILCKCIQERQSAKDFLKISVDFREVRWIYKIVSKLDKAPFYQF